MLTSDRTIKWIENLADQERSLGSQERGAIDLCHTKDEILGVETSIFVRELAHQFAYLAKLFNVRVLEPILQLKVVHQPESPQCVVISRQRMKLTVSTRQPGTIQIQCDKILPSEVGISPSASVMFSGLIEAKFETFHDVEWYFLGSKLQAEQVARHYLTEFLQVSRTVRHL